VGTDTVVAPLYLINVTTLTISYPLPKCINTCFKTVRMWKFNMDKQECLSGVPEVRLDLKRFICVYDECYLKDALSAFFTRAHSKPNLSLSLSLSMTHMHKAHASICIKSFYWLHFYYLHAIDTSCILIFNCIVVPHVKQYVSLTCGFSNVASQWRWWS